MPLLSRFKKGKASTDDDIEALADVEEEEGLLIATGDQQDASEAQAEQKEAPVAALADPEAADAEDAPDEPGDEEEADEPADAEEADEPADAEEADVPTEVAAGAPADAAEAPAATDGGAGGAGDDMLSAFRGAEAVTEYGHLTDDIEDIPMTQLLEEAREVRSMLPAVEEEGGGEGEGSSE